MSQHLPSSESLRHLKRASLALPASPGECFDRLTILRIKRRKSPADRRDHLTLQIEKVEYELSWQGDYATPPELEALVEELSGINEQLWEVEDDIRLMDSLVFPVENATRINLVRHAELARQIYVLNTKRHDAKRRIDEACGRTPEVKHYAAFKE